MNTRQQKLFDLEHELRACPPSAFSDRTRVSYLAAALWMVTAKTLMEEDARGIIERICPEFFHEAEEEK